MLLSRNLSHAHFSLVKKWIMKKSMTKSLECQLDFRLYGPSQPALNILVYMAFNNLFIYAQKTCFKDLLFSRHY